MNKRQHKIVDALEWLGGAATMAEISDVTGISVNGLSQTLSAMEAGMWEKVTSAPGLKADAMIKLTADCKRQLKLGTRGKIGMADNQAAESSKPVFRRVQLEEMGRVTDPRSVQLSEDFVKRYVNIDDDEVNDPQTGAKLACPFCQIGAIELADVNLTLTDHGPMLTRHVNGYEVYLRCNCDCGAAFFGSVRTRCD